MNLIKIAEEIWSHRIVLETIPSEKWNNNFLKKKWFDDYPGIYVSKSPGWYWIGCKVEHEELLHLNLIKKGALAKGACEIPSVAKDNIKTFGSNLCRKDEEGCQIIYNGHQGSVLSRLRQHFVLKNQNTGAIGLNYYPLSNREWTISFFTEKHIDGLSLEIQGKVSNLIKSKSGRVAIENAWRAKFGWPILCKE